MLRRRFVAVTGYFAAAWTARNLPAAEDGASAAAPPNWQLPTFGGLQYWADEQILHGYRIQRHAMTGHFRLLDAREERLAWGTFEQCRARLDEIKQTEKLKPPPKRVVLTLHGIIRTRHSMSALADYVSDKSKCAVYQVGYPSTQQTMPELAATFDRLVRRLDGVEEIDVAAFSMGNLVLRHWLGDVAAEAAESRTANGTRSAPATARPRLRRVVMIGPPNNGARRAHLWQTSPINRELFRFVLGDAGEQLGPRFDEIKDRLAVPDCEFGIIAGGKSDGQGWHAEIPGDDDGTVGVEETKLPGAADFAVVPVRHTWLISDRRVLEMTRSFLDRGYFVSEARRTPLPK